MNGREFLDLFGDLPEDMVDEIAPYLKRMPAQEMTETDTEDAAENAPPELHRQKGTGVLPYLLTAGCTAACIAGFVLLGRMSVPRETYTVSSAGDAAYVEIMPTTAAQTETTAATSKTTVTTTEATALTTRPEPAVSAAETVHSIQTESAPLMTAKTTAERQMERVIKAVTQDTAAETKSVSTVTETVTTMQTAKRKPEPAADVKEKQKQAAQANKAWQRTLYEEAIGYQYGEEVLPDAVISITVYAEDAAESERIIEQYPNLQTVPQGENCWKICPPSCGYIKFGTARKLVSELDASADCEMLDIEIADVVKPLSYPEKAPLMYCIPNPDMLASNPLEVYAEYLDLERSETVEFEQPVEYADGRDTINSELCLYFKDQTDFPAFLRFVRKVIAENAGMEDSETGAKQFCLWFRGSRIGLGRNCPILDVNETLRLYGMSEKLLEECLHEQQMRNDMCEPDSSILDAWEVMERYGLDPDAVAISMFQAIKECGYSLGDILAAGSPDMFDSESLIE